MLNRTACDAGAPVVPARPDDAATPSLPSWQSAEVWRWRVVASEAPGPPGLLVQAAAASAVAQYLHLVASSGRSAALHSGQVLVGSGSLNTVVPRRRM
jgi:hypothetical protein